MRTQTRNRPVKRAAQPLTSALSRTFSAYVAASVASGIGDATAWRLARKRDGSIHLAVTLPDGSEHIVSRIAGGETEALYSLTRATDALSGH